MRFREKDPPRRFSVGQGGAISLSDCGDLLLESDEQVTIRVPGQESVAFDVTRKSFGYYAMNSLNGTLPRQGLRAALCRNEAHGLLYILLVETGKEADYRAYLEAESMAHLTWLDEVESAP